MSPISHSPGLPPIVGFCGAAQAGKSSAALMLGAYDYHRISFADRLRRMLLALGLTADDLSANKEVPHLLLGGKTPRQAMQTLGTEWGRERIDSELWLRAARNDAMRILDLPGRAVFDDVRFDNEAQMIRALGGHVIRIIRPGQVIAAGEKHASELGIDPALITATLYAHDYLQLQHVVQAHFNSLLPAIDRPALDAAQAIGESELPAL